ncbi:MAG TPA: choice-of-anchor D domain-containing protein [Acidobacteriaceae bacterium]
MTYVASAYALDWTCAGGTVTITSSDHSLAFTGRFLSGAMVYSSSGGGRGGHVVDTYRFNGSFSGTMTSGGVTQFAYGSVAQTVDTSGLLGTASAPVSAGSFGWNSGYSPLMVGDKGNSRVLLADNITGANLTAAGEAGTGVGQFGTVAGLAQDASLRFYASDSGLDRVVRFNDQAFDGWTSVGSAGTGTLHFKRPSGIVVDGSGRIWVADTGNHRIVRFDDMTGANWTSFGTLGSGVDQFNAPTSIAFDLKGRIYVADAGNNRLVRIDNISGTGWTTLTKVSIGTSTYDLSGPSSVAINGSGQVYVALASGYLLRVNDIGGANGSASYWGGALTAMSLDKAGTIYLAGTFVPGLAQVVDAAADGYFASLMGVKSLEVSALLALSTPQPPPAAPVLSVSSLYFGSRNVGEPSAAKSLTVLNLGAAPLTFTSLHTTADYAATTDCPLVLAGGASCSTSVVFKPTTAGTRTGTLTLGSKSVHPVETVGLSGLGTAPKPVLLPTALTFDPQRVSTTSSTQVVTLTNTGSGPLTLKSFVVTGAFSQTSNCPEVLLAGAGCTIQVAFKPSGAGAASGGLTVSDDAVAGGAKQVVTLSGTGTAAAPAFLLSPESLQFPDQKVGTTSVGQTITLTNNSGATVTLAAPTYTSGFKATSTCGSSLANAASCNYSVVFAPSVAGVSTGSLTIPVTGGVALHAGLSGTAVAAGKNAVLSVAPASVAFGEVPVGDSVAIDTVVTNPSALPVGLGSITVSGDSTFSLSTNTCPAVLAGNARCTVGVTFLPLATSSYQNSGLLTVVEASGAVTQVTLSGDAAPAVATAKP